MPPNPEPIRVALVEDIAEERDALSHIISGSPGFTCLAAFASGEEAVEKIPALNPHIILMDIHLPGISGIDCVRKLKSLLPAARIMMLTIFEDHDRIFESLRAGASGYLLKKTPPARLLEAVKELHEGGAPMSAPIACQVVAAFHQSASEQQPTEKLSKREDEILGLLNQGFLYKEIGDKLGISIGTVRTHIARIYDKLHVSSRAQAMLKAMPRLPTTS
jgi:DNA-binding NarL/FixJ family response regulator